ncbi:MAG: glutamate formiminotransferase [Acidimicrobiales bacterium]
MVNVSCGTTGKALAAVIDAAGDTVLDVHVDRSHNRSVLTLAGPDVAGAARAVTAAAVERLDLTTHLGAHPRFGVVDVVPFVPLRGSTLVDALAARDAHASWAATTLALPCFLYGPERSLPDVRRGAWGSLPPDVGPDQPHPTAGASAVGARDVLVAYNVWLAEPDLDVARAIAREVRGPALRALAMRLGAHVQVSMNLIDPVALGPAAAYDLVAARTRLGRAELVGLVPAAVLAAVDRSRWSQLDLAEERTIEARLGRSS